MLGTAVSSAAGAGLGGLLGQLGEGLSAPRKGLWSMLGLPEHGADLVSQGLGLDRDSALAQALGIGAEIAGDPLMYAGSVLGPLARMGGRGMMGAREAGMAGEGVEAMGAGRQPAMQRFQMGREFALPEAVGPPEYVPPRMLESRPGYAQNIEDPFGLGRAVTLPAVGEDPMLAILAGQEAQASAQALAEQAAMARMTQASGETLGAPRLPVAAGPQQQALQEYQGTIGALHDQSTELLGKGFATTDEHILNTQMGQELLEQLGVSARENLNPGPLMPGEIGYGRAASGLGGNPDLLGPLGQREAEALLMRKHLANVEGMIPGISDIPQDSPLYDSLAVPAVEQAGEPYRAGAGIDRLLQRGIPGLEGMDTGNLGLVNELQARSAGEPSSFADSFIDMFQRQGAAYAANPELQQARRLSRAGEQLALGQAAPEQVPALIEELRRYGIPVDPKVIQQGYRSNATSNLNMAAGDLNANLLLPAAEDRGLIEALEARGGGDLLRQLGPERFSRRITNLEGALDNTFPDAYQERIRGWAGTEAGHLENYLIQVLRARGLI